MPALLLGRYLLRRIYLTLLAVLLVLFVMVVNATPSHAAAAATNGGSTSLSASLSAGLDMRRVPRVRGPDGALQCVAGDYARATNRWTNAYGQTLAVGMYVRVNSVCQVQFREHLVGSGSNGCNFDSDNAAIFESFAAPPNMTRGNSVALGHANFAPKLNDGNCDHWFTGTPHNTSRDWIISTDNHFHVHFLSPDHQGVDHAGCSQALINFFFDESHPNPCFYY